MDNKHIAFNRNVVLVSYILFALSVDYGKWKSMNGGVYDLKGAPEIRLGLLSFALDLFVVFHLVAAALPSYTESVSKSFGLAKLVVLVLFLLFFWKEPAVLSTRLVHLFSNVKIATGVFLAPVCLHLALQELSLFSPKADLAAVVSVLMFSFSISLWCRLLGRMEKVSAFAGSLCTYAKNFKVGLMLAGSLSSCLLLQGKASLNALLFAAVSFSAVTVAALQATLAVRGNYCESALDVFRAGLLGNEVVLALWFSALSFLALNYLLRRHSPKTSVYESLDTEKAAVEKDAWQLHLALLLANQVLYAMVGEYRLHGALNRSTVVHLLFRVCAVACAAVAIANSVLRLFNTNSLPLT